MPRTPPAARPIERTSASLKRMLMPSLVISTTSSPGSPSSDAAARQFHVNQRVARLNADGDDAALADVGKFVERGFLHRALLRGEEQFAGLRPRHVLLVRVGLGQNADERGDFFVGLQFQQIRDAPAFGGAAHVGNLMHALDIHAAGVREEHQVIMRAGGEQMLDEIVVLGGLAFARGHADDALAAAPLRAILADVRALDAGRCA